MGDIGEGLHPLPLSAPARHAIRVRLLVRVRVRVRIRVRVS